MEWYLLPNYHPDTGDIIRLCVSDNKQVVLQWGPRVIFVETLEDLAEDILAIDFLTEPPPVDE